MGDEPDRRLTWLLVVVVLSVLALVVVGTLAGAEEPPVLEYHGGPIKLKASEAILSVTPANAFIEGDVYFPDGLKGKIRFWQEPFSEGIRWAAPPPVQVRERTVKHFVVIVKAGEFRDLAGNINDEPAQAYIIVNASAPNAVVNVMKATDE